MATIRNQDLDSLFRGHSLGAAPLDRKLWKVRLRFGTISIDGMEGASKILRKRTVRHVTFGLEHTVSKLKKGNQCI